VPFGVLQELRARELVCPTDVSVVGYSDAPASELVAPALTTVAVDHWLRFTLS
jgi:LacI family transcriptional regulator